MTTDLRRAVLVSALALTSLIACVAPTRLSAYTFDDKKNDTKKKEFALVVCTVWGADNRPAYGVPVKVRLKDQKKNRWDSVSNHSGEVAFRLPVGPADYILTADVKTAKGKAKPTVTAHVFADEKVEVGIHLTE